METVAKWIIVLAISAAIITLLPASFVQSMLSTVNDVPYLAEINWLLPIHQMYAVSITWLTAIGAYYLISWICREIGIID